MKTRTLRNFTATIALVVLVISPSFAGGPWLTKKKSGYIQMQGVLPAYRYKGMIMGTLQNIQGVNRLTYNADFGIYGEYGISDRWNVIANVPIKYIATGEQTDSLYFSDLLESGSMFGLSNTGIALKYGILDKKFKLAVSAQARLNTIQKDFSRGLATGFDANSIGLVAHMGGSFGQRSYAFFEGGFHKYFNNFSDVIEAKVEYGRKMGKKQQLTMIFALDVRQSLRNGSYSNPNLEQTGFYPNDQEWMVISGKLNYELKSKWGFNLGLPLVPIKLHRVGFNGTVALGIYKKW